MPYPIEMVFAFFADPENLPRLMPQWQKARIDKANLVAAEAPALSAPPPTLKAAGKGSRMTISFRPFPFSPFRLRWQAAIVEFEWNRYFCDEQPKGPFAYWRHCHLVSEQRSGAAEGTLIMDDLVYELPFGLLSEPAHKLFVRRQIESIFDYRHRRLKAILSTKT